VRFLAFVFASLSLAWTSVAHATCPVAYTTQQLVGDMSTVQVALRELDEVSYRAAGERLRKGLRCLEGAPPPVVFAAVYRYLGAFEAVQGNEDMARRWFRSSLELDPAFVWDVADFDVGHPIRNVFDEEKSVAKDPPVAMEGVVFRLGEGESLTIDGRPLNKPEARMERPHLVQQVGADGQVIAAWVIDGNKFPADIVAEPSARAKKAEAKKSKKSKKKIAKEPERKVSDEGDDVVVMQRIRPATKTPMIAAGGAGLVASGALYYASVVSQGDFYAATTTDDVLALQAATNRLVMLSAGLGVAAAGLGTWGIILHGSGFGLTWQW